MVTATAIDLARAREIAASVVDPEIPILTIADLGVLRGIGESDGRVIVTITPTYSGCPAMRQIEDDVLAALHSAGYAAEVQITHSPPWTTEWMSDEARDKLDRFGIAPPVGAHEVVCPRCRQDEPIMVSIFGSTACKALMVCSSCGEPFDYFKRF